MYQLNSNNIALGSHERRVLHALCDWTTSNNKMHMKHSKSRDSFNKYQGKFKDLDKDYSSTHAQIDEIA